MANFHVGLLLKWVITEICRSPTHAIVERDWCKKKRNAGSLNNLIPDIIPYYNLVKFMFAQIKPHRNQSSLNQHFPVEDESVQVSWKEFLCSTLLDAFHTVVYPFFFFFLPWSLTKCSQPAFVSLYYFLTDRNRLCVVEIRSGIYRNSVIENEYMHIKFTFNCAKSNNHRSLLFCALPCPHFIFRWGGLLAALFCWHWSLLS